LKAIETKKDSHFYMPISPCILTPISFFESINVCKIYIEFNNCTTYAKTFKTCK
jgi:hypothetical protein